MALSKTARAVLPSIAQLAIESAQIKRETDRILDDMERRPPRAILPLLKARITGITDGGFTLAFGAEYGSPTTIRIAADTCGYDLRDGDLLTLYTEVLLARH